MESNSKYPHLSKVLNKNYRITQFRDNKPIAIEFDDGISYNEQELKIISTMDNPQKIEVHKIKYLFGGMIFALDNICQGGI